MTGTTEQVFDEKLGQLLLGRYRIVRKLGEGGMGAVYEGKHELIGKRLAIKCLHAQYTSNKEVVERFHREAHAATAVGNEHIIEVNDVGAFEDGSPFIVMEFLEGVEFGALIEREGSLPIGRLVHIVTQVCGALSSAHARGIVHRDMKPENIYLIKRGMDQDFAKVLDFGISKMREHNEALGAGLTKTGMALGTPYYMPPEQAQGVRDIDHRADIYAVGVILYQGLTGRLPFDADSYPALMVKILTEQPQPPRRYRQDVPEPLEQIVLRAMAKDRNVRFQSMDELAGALNVFAGIDFAPVMIASMHPPGTSETTPFSWTNKPETTPPARAAPNNMPMSTPAPLAQSNSMLVISSAALALVVAIAAFLFMRTNQGPASAPLVAAPVAVAPAAAAPAPATLPIPTAQIVEPPPQIAAAPKPAEVSVKLMALPREARIYIGEVEFPNPMDAFRPRSLDPVRVRIEAPGYRTVEQLAIFDQDRSAQFVLERGKGVKHLDTLGAPPEQAGKSAQTPTQVAGTITVKPENTKTDTQPVAKPASDDGVYHGPSGTIRDNF